MEEDPDLRRELKKARIDSEASILAGGHHRPSHSSHRHRASDGDGVQPGVYQ